MWNLASCAFSSLVCVEEAN